MSNNKPDNCIEHRGQPENWEWEAVKDGIVLEVKLEVVARNGNDGKIVAGWGIGDQKMITQSELKIAIDPVLPNLGQRLVDAVYKGFISAHGSKFLDALRIIQNSAVKSGLVRVLKEKTEDSKIIITN
jgi:hypothetical protein